MGRKSTIKMLPKAVQAAISKLHRAGYTNQQITQHLRELGGNTVSKSAVQRWAKDLNRVGKRLQESRQIGIPSSAEQVAAALGWCAERHLIRQEEIEGYIIATLTPRGADVAGDKAHAPGVARSLE